MAKRLHLVLSLVGLLFLLAAAIAQDPHRIPPTDSDVQRAIGAPPSRAQRVA